MKYKLLVFFSGMLILKKHSGMCSLIFEGKGSGKVFAFGLFLFSSLPVLDRAGYGFFGSENGKKKPQNKPRCTWNLKGLEEISGGILCSKNAVCSKSVSCETELPTQDFLHPLGHLVHFSSSVTATRSTLGPELQALKGQAIPSRMHLAICYLPSYKKCHISH